ncbi:kinase-like protein [Pholiota conissans]|uniref:Kinase-like protein n=1 Tax=Pholiota conissans TaxID=109636 RepID=A0A9P5YUT0_9AGAR|nr:kinase-like protein [Pholiota conissans]
MAVLSDFEFDFDAFDKPPVSGSMKSATICTRRDNGIKYIIKRKRAARNTSWSEQTILETLTTLETPFVMRLCWSFYSGEHIYIVMDCDPENNFMDLIREHGPLGIHHATHYASELVTAISSLHDAGIMHRDIEPRNIKLDTKGHIVLTNFSLAELTGQAIAGVERASVPSDLDCTSTVYRAPELLLCWDHDGAVDCWSFGMLLYYMVFGMHPFGGRQGVQDDYAWVYDRIIHSSIPTESLRLVHPMARDLILRCLERNPALRWDMSKIKSHAYFASVDWKKVASRDVDVLPLRTAPAIPTKISSTAIHDAHQRYSSFTSSSADLDALKRITTHQCAQSIEKLCAGILEPPCDEPSQLFTSLLLSSDEIPPPSNAFRPLSRFLDVLEEEDRVSALDKHTGRYDPDISCEPRSQDTRADRISQFWDDFDKEQDNSGVSINSLEFGAATGVPYYKAPKLRKYRSAIQSRSRLFNVSTSSFHNRLQKKPRSTGALRPPRPAEVYENLPLGIHQIGSGIGFKYNVPAATSKVSVVSFAPSCHLFQRGFSVRNLGLSLGGSAGAKKAKNVGASTSNGALNEPAATTTAINTSGATPATSVPTTSLVSSGSKVVGNGAFVREMCQSPVWILSPPESLPSPLVLVNSPASSGSEPLSPITLVDAAENENCHVNITIPKNLELDSDFPLSTWAPTSTLRLVPPSLSSSKIPCLDSGDTSIYTDTSD